MTLDGAIVDEMQMRSPLGKAKLVREVLITYVRMRWLLLRRGLPGTVAALRATGVPALSDPELLQQVRSMRLGNGVARTLRVLPTDGRCLMRSLVLLGLLAKRGIAATLVIGVRTEGGFLAHAWLELGGVALLESHGEAYSRLVEL
jgi:hypothetical protein